MPLYRPSDLGNADRTPFHVPLETLARDGRNLSDAQVMERISIATHEAAHLLAAVWCRSSVVGVTIKPRYGVAGRFASSERLPDETAFIALVGVAWEEAHGDIALAAQDQRDGESYAAEAGVPVELLMDEARRFVASCEELIRYAAAGVLALAPKSGTLEGRALAALIDWFRPIAGQARGESKERC